MSSEYTAEVVSELSSMVRSGIWRWGLRADSEVKLINLSENATFRVKDQRGGQDLILRVQRPGYSSSREISSELSWIKALSAQQVVSTAAVIPAVSGSEIVTLISEHGLKRLCVAFSRLGGSEPDASLNLPHWFEVIGALSAKMHQQSRTWQRPTWFTRKVWDFDHIIGSKAYWGQWSDAPELTRAEHDVIAKTVLALKAITDSYGITRHNFGVIHADLRTANLLVEREDLHVLDFDDMGFGWYLFDFASSLSFLETSPLAPQLLKAWITGYEQHSPLSQEEKDLLPAFSIMRRIELLAWVTSHSEVPFAAKITPGFAADTAALCTDFLQGRYLKNA